MRTAARTLPLFTALLLASACLVLAGPGDLPVAVAETVGMSTSRLERLQPWLAGMVEDRRAAGFVTLVARRGRIVHHRATGRRGMDVADPMPLGALFDVASMTKPLTAVAALILYEEGKVTLADPVADHLPEFSNRTVASESGTEVPAKREMTIRHLFTHTSGVRDPRGRVENYGFPTMADYMPVLARIPLGAEPGSRWIYGDSLDVLGHLVERVAGMGLDRFLQERMLDPLEMSDTHYWPPESLEGRRALLVVDGTDDPTRESREPIEAGKRKSFISGASGLHMTAADYWKFCQMLLNGGELDGRRILGPRTVALMAENHLERGTNYRPGLGFGLGVAVVMDRARTGLPYSVGSYYWGGSQGTVFWIDPEEQLVGVLMVQARPREGLRLRERFAAIVYSAILE